MKIKDLLVSIFCLFFIQMANAQTQKGKIQLAGYMSSKISLNENGSGSYFFPSATVGYFLSDHFLVKGELVAAVNMNNDVNRERVISFGIGAGTGVKYYFGEKKLQPFVGLDAYYATNQNFLGMGINYNHLGITFEPGISYFLNKNIAIEIGFPIFYQKNLISEPSSFTFVPPYYFSGTLSTGFQIYLK